MVSGVYFPPCFCLLGSRYIYILNNVWLPGITLRDLHRFNFLKPVEWTFQRATVRCATKTPWSPFIPQFINHLAQIKWNQSGVFLRWNHRSRTRDKCTSCFFPQRWLSSESRQTNSIVGTEMVSMRNSGKRKFSFLTPPSPFSLSMITACPSICSRPVGNILSLWGFLGRGKELMSLPHKDSEDKETGPLDS